MFMMFHLCTWWNNQIKIVHYPSVIGTKLFFEIVKSSNPSNASYVCFGFQGLGVCEGEGSGSDLQSMTPWQNWCLIGRGDEAYHIEGISMSLIFSSLMFAATFVYHLQSLFWLATCGSPQTIRIQLGPRVWSFCHIFKRWTRN